MNITVSDETGEALLTLARQQGYIVSPTQLVRWHRAGLLPRPRQLPLKEGRGTRSLYPEGTGEQLLLLCQLRTSERRLAHLAWHLWLAGYPVAYELIQAQLAPATQRLARRIGWLDDFKQAIEAGDLSGDALDLLERYAEGDLGFQPLRCIRKRVGRELFPSFFRILIELVTEASEGATHAYDEDERLLDLRILTRGLGLEKRFVQQQDYLESYLVQVLRPQVHWFFGGLHEVDWDHLLENTTDFEILQTRDELEFYVGLREKMPIAFFNMSRSCRKSSFSRFKWRFSSSSGGRCPLAGKASFPCSAKRRH